MILYSVTQFCSRMTLFKHKSTKVIASENKELSFALVGIYSHFALLWVYRGYSRKSYPNGIWIVQDHYSIAISNTLNICATKHGRNMRQRQGFQLVIFQCGEQIALSQLPGSLLSLWQQALRCCISTDTNHVTKTVTQTTLHTCFIALTASILSFLV